MKHHLHLDKEKKTMKQFKGFDEAKKSADRTVSAQLPAGAYVAKVMNVRYEQSEAENLSDRIQVQFDIAEGEYKDFFKNQYDSNTNEDRRWKGKATIYVPSDDGSEKDGWTKNTFAKWTNSFEKSNKGYAWDWDETKWKNKLIGLVFRKVGTVIEGKEITYTEVAFPVDASLVRSGNAPEAKFKAKNGYTGAQKSSSSSKNDDFMDIPVNADEEIPF